MAANDRRMRFAAIVLRLPEPYHMKLQYIAAHTPYSMQRFIQEVLTAAIDAKIAEFTDRG